ncbi:AfsR/SARP family transcriptional regulator [Kibdelosporangium persicum]|uniref:Regulatory protein AfsR n=1 Tax=Kibdelosporangium persicum TaxID=2698649 RepID=A0ABX2F5H5_9PSEU|nr:AfsR/SARP family transcriptional regulator [Kibdelosporangium persicum]NRN66438.1 Regulatory protein AfsR [Kibdelosporangium persicum]
MNVGALGPVEVVANGVRANLGGAKPRTLLAALLVEPGQVVGIERLVDMIWDERPPQSAVALVHTYVSSLRRSFASIGAPAAVATRAPGYVLEIEPGDVDIVAFAQGLAQGRRAEQLQNFHEATELYRQALALWRGPAFGGVEAGFARARAMVIEDERLAVEEGLARCELALGNVSAALSRLSALSTAHPLREDARALLMRALYQSGRQADALTAYREGRERLITELGVEPGAALRELHSQILAGTLSGPAPAQKTATSTIRPPAPRQPTAAPSRIPNQLPPDIADFTGRAEQVTRVVRLARSQAHSAAPIVVSGVGGSGKSALAVHCAHLLAGDYPDGQLFADLRRTGNPVDAGDVLGRFLRALGVPAADLPDDPDERVELYRMTVAGRRLVIVLDNARAEHQVRPLLPGSGTCLVIVTSRARLTGLAGAEPIELDILSTETSVEMLGRIIGTERVDSEPDVAATIGGLCAGLPLAIRVAGAKLLARAHWPLRMLATRLADERRRLDELAVGDLAIRSSLELHYAELDSECRRVFHLLALLDLPGFGAWLAVPLLDVSPARAEDLVEHLVDLRLLDIAGIDALGRVRYRFHELVRIFGAEQGTRHEPAGVISEALSRMLHMLMALVEAGAARMTRVTLGLRLTPPTEVRLDPLLAADAMNNPTDWFASETTTMVRAVERARELGAEESSTLLITSLLSSPFVARNEFDGWKRMHDAGLDAAARSGDKRAEAAILAGLGQVYYERDDFAASLEYFQRALGTAVAAGEKSIQAVALVGIGTVQRDLARFTEAGTSLVRAAELARHIGDGSLLAAAKYGLGAIDRDHGDLSVAARAFEECVELYRELDDPRGEALALRGLSLCRRAEGDAESAAALSEDAYLILARVGDFLGAAYALQSLAKAKLRQGQPGGVAEILAACLRICADHGDRFGTALTTRTLGDLALATGDPAAATEHLETAVRLWHDLNLPLWEGRTLRDLAAAVLPQDPAAAEDHWSRALALLRANGAREAGELAGLAPRDWLNRVLL